MEVVFEFSAIIEMDNSDKTSDDYSLMGRGQ